MTWTPISGMVTYILMPIWETSMPPLPKPGLTTLPLKTIWTRGRRRRRGDGGGAVSRPPRPRARARPPRGAPHLVGHHAADGLAGQHHAVLPVLHDDGLRAGQPVLRVAEVVVDEHAEVAVHGHHLLHQHVGAVVQEGVVGAVEGDVVGVAPAAAHTCGRTRGLSGACASGLRSPAPLSQSAHPSGAPRGAAVTTPHRTVQEAPEEA